MGVALAWGTFLAWHRLVLRAVPAPLISVPFFPLSHPRADEAWLAASAAVIVLAFALGAFPVFGRFARRLPLAAIAGTAVAAMVAGGGCVLGASASLESVVAGGVLCGVGELIYIHLLLCMLAAGGRPSRGVFVGGLAVAGAVDSVLIVLMDGAALGVLFLLPVISLTALLALGHPFSEARAGKAEGEEQADSSGADGVADAGGRLRGARCPRLVSLLLSCVVLALFLGLVGFEADAVDGGMLLSYQAGLMAAGSVLAVAVLAGIRWIGDAAALQIAVLVLIATGALMLPFSGAAPFSAIANVIAQASLLCLYGLIVDFVRDSAVATGGGGAVALECAAYQRGGFLPAVRCFVRRDGAQPLRP
ncbi:hypothetical protein VJ918_00685 [Adlercreutzia sp. R21]|uniref:Uncharacterized protein n=1 Tax=Adlercreutzia wanghongyangiae TaxID=3111451 RepID=A0ABU6IGB2_9ACTN|nr:hypothetical protein [Adlercreutzia sp. R21]MEC4175466.1 hypothetical protein [Adlercreutzia sp. R7]MEC4183319.1 hypothetical protein [Adlercreutzia sp. R21]